MSHKILLVRPTKAPLVSRSLSHVLLEYRVWLHVVDAREPYAKARKAKLPPELERASAPREGEPKHSRGQGGEISSTV